MRRFYTLAVMCLLSVAAMAQLLPDNWTVGSAALTVTQEETTVSDGTSAVNAVWTSQSNQDFVSEMFDVTAGAAFTCEIDVYDNDAAGKARLAIIWDTNNDYQGYSADQDSWQTLSYIGDVPVGATTAYIKIRFYDISADWDGDAQVVLDNAIYSEDAGVTNLVVNPSFEMWSEPVIEEYTIMEIQGELESSPLENEVVQTNGIVTAIFADGYFIQDGDGAWNGVYVFDDTNTAAIGDSLTIIGLVAEFYGKTQITSVTSFMINSSANTLPTPVMLPTFAVNAEMYEGVLVSVNSAMVTVEDNGNGEFIIDDGSGVLVIDDLMYVHTPLYLDIYNITGAVDYSFGEYKLEPRDVNDIELLGNAMDNAIDDAIANTSIEVTPEAQTVFVEEDIVIAADLVFPQTVDDLLVDYYVDAMISFDGAIPNDISLSVTFSQNGSEPIEVGPFNVPEGTTDSYVSELLSLARTLLSDHAGLYNTWGVTLSGLPIGTYDVTMDVVINTEAGFGTDDVVLASDVAGAIVVGGVEITSQPVDLTICVGATTDFTIEATGTEPLVYAWYFMDELMVDEVSNMITTDQEGAYYCIVSDENSSIQSEVWNLMVSSPSVDLGEDAEYCENFEVILDAGDFETYLWNNDEVTQTIMPDTSGTYTVEVMDMYGCSATDELIITFDPEWTFNLPTIMKFCEGEALTITLPDADAWVWSTGETSQSIDISEEIIVYVTITQGSCVVEDSIDVESSVNPPEFDLGNDLYLCTDDVYTLESPIYSSQYLWSTGATGNSIEITEAGLYSLTLINAAGCTSYDELSVYFNDFMVVMLGDTVYSCLGQQVLLSPGPADSLVWDNGTEVDSLVVTDPGWYYVTVVDDLGCEGSDSAYVFFYELPEVFIGNDTAFCDGNSLEISAPMAENYEWNTGDTIQTIVVDEGNSYIVTITDENGCKNNDLRILTIWDNPFVDLGPDKVITEDQTIVIGVEPGHPTYVWSTGATTDFIVINGLDLGVGEHLITVTVISGDDCESYGEVIVTVLEGVGISTTFAEGISMYPNPANQNVLIETGNISDFVQLEIINIEGKIIYKTTENNSLFDINVEAWQTGMYLVRIISESDTAVLKLIKK